MNQSSVIVLDISVLLFDPEAIYGYPMKEVVLPVGILESLDLLKMELGEEGRTAQIVSQMLEKFCQNGSLADGISLTNGSILRVDLSNPEECSIPYDLQSKNCSNRILAVAWLLSQKNKEVVFVSLNENLRTKAGIIGVKTVSYNGHRRDDSILYSGLKNFEVSKENLRNYSKKTSILPADLFSLEHEKFEIFPNQGLLLRSNEVPDEDILLIYNKEIQKFELVKKELGVWGVRPRNVEQCLAIGLLMNPKISIVSLSGKAGTGKTLLALAVGLQQMLVNKIYSRMLVSRPIFPMGRDIGFLPGDTQEKLVPWMQPIFDNLEILINSSNSKKDSNRGTYNELINKGLLTVEPLTYIRGRTIPNQFLIVDEAQNLTLHEMKTIVTRAGEGTKIVLTGDPNQIDNSKVNLSSNGMSKLVERFKDSNLAGHVRFSTVERSGLAELAAKIL